MVSSGKSLKVKSNDNALKRRSIDKNKPRNDEAQSKTGPKKKPRTVM